MCGKTKNILTGLHNTSTDLWTLPIMDNKPHPQQAPKLLTNATPCRAYAAFTHSVRTRMNVVCFLHQSLGNPRISTLLKAARKSFLQGCPNIIKKLILKYLNPSPANAKGHMKQPRHGIRSTTPRVALDNIIPLTVVQEAPIHGVQHPLSKGTDQDDVGWGFPPIYEPNEQHIIEDDEPDSHFCIWCICRQEQWSGVS